MPKDFLGFGSGIGFSWRVRRDYKHTKRAIHIYRKIDGLHDIDRFLCGLPNMYSISVQHNYISLSFDEVQEHRDIACKTCWKRYMDFIHSCSEISNRMDVVDNFLTEEISCNNIEQLKEQLSYLEEEYERLTDWYNEMKGISDASMETNFGEGRFKNIEPKS